MLEEIVIDDLDSAQVEELLDLLIIQLQRSKLNLDYLELMLNKL